MHALGSCANCLLSFHAVLPSFSSHLKKNIPCGGKCSKALAYLCLEEGSLLRDGLVKRQQLGQGRRTAAEI